jgi:transaldolase
MNALDQLKQYSKVVSDTGDFESIRSYNPLDATTNPSLILKAAQCPQYNHLIDKAVEYAKKQTNNFNKQISIALDKMAVNFGAEILKIVPGRVSTEVDARLSFDKENTIKKARKLIELYEKDGITKEKILIKIASTWEGIRAAEILENEGIHCNLTLLFSQVQAIACAQARVTLISPFVGRIYDWYCKSEGVDHIEAENDPGVLSVTQIFDYFKKFGYQTEIMGASFRNIKEIIQLAGCDLLTISPSLLQELEKSNIQVEQKLTISRAQKKRLSKIEINETSFRWMLNENAMATEKLAEGIRNFTKDLLKLESIVIKRLKAMT